MAVLCSIHSLHSLVDNAMSEIEKAYGGCRICYGKGYHTKRVGTSSRYGNVTHDTIGYCSCDRGKQLEAVISGRISEVLDRLLKETNKQIKASKENLRYQQEVTKNERLVREWGSTVLGENWIKELIASERKRLGGENG